MKKNIVIFLSTIVASAVIVGLLRIAFMPLIVTGKALKKNASVKTVDETTLQAPINQLALARRTYTSDMDIGAYGMTGPGVDVLYGQGWLDVSKEPMIFDIPDFGDRYFVIQLTNRWNTVDGYIGTRATGGRRGRYAVVCKDWKGNLPAGIERITASTKEINVLFRVFVADSDDFAAADSLRRKAKLYPLSSLGAK